MRDTKRVELGGVVLGFLSPKATVFRNLTRKWGENLVEQFGGTVISSYICRVPFLLISIVE